MSKSIVGRGMWQFIGASIFIIFQSYSSCIAQQIDNLKVVKIKDEIFISFDLKAASSPQEMYDINIYCSYNEYATAVELKEGIIKDVFPKLNMKYTIDAKKAFTGFEGEIDFKIVATLSFMPISFVYPTQIMKIKTGKSVEMMWKGGLDTDAYKLEYSNNGGDWNALESDIHDNKFTWFIPKKTQKGIYTMKLTSSEPRAKAAFSGNITIKKKKSPFVVIIPLLAIGAGGYYYYTNYMLPKDEIIIPVDNSLPPPPKPSTIGYAF